MRRHFTLIWSLLSFGLLPKIAFADSIQVLEAFHRACGKNRTEQVRIYLSALKGIRSNSHDFSQRLKSHSEDISKVTKKVLASNGGSELFDKWASLDRQLKELKESNGVIQDAHYSLGDQERAKKREKFHFEKRGEPGRTDFLKALRLVEERYIASKALMERAYQIENSLKNEFSKILGLETKRADGRELLEVRVDAEDYLSPVNLRIYDQNDLSVSYSWNIESPFSDSSSTAEFLGVSFMDWALEEAGINETNILSAKDADLSKAAESVVDGALSRSIIIDNEVGGTILPNRLGFASNMAETLNPLAEEVLRHRMWLTGPVQYCADPLLLGFERARLKSEAIDQNSDAGTPDATPAL